MDTDGNGLLSKEELIAFYERAGQDVEDPEVRAGWPDSSREARLIP
jgi:hypothetical protein